MRVICFLSNVQATAGLAKHRRIRGEAASAGGIRWMNTADVCMARMQSMCGLGICKRGTRSARASKECAVLVQ